MDPSSGRPCQRDVLRGGVPSSRYYRPSGVPCMPVGLEVVGDVAGTLCLVRRCPHWEISTTRQRTPVLFAVPRPRDRSLTEQLRPILGEGMCGNEQAGRAGTRCRRGWVRTARRTHRVRCPAGRMHYPQAGYWLDVGDTSTVLLGVMKPCTPRDACGGGPIVRAAFANASTACVVALRRGDEGVVALCGAARTLRPQA